MSRTIRAVLVMALVVMVAGACARRPVGTQTSAPAPAGASAAERAGAPASAVSTASTPGSVPPAAARPGDAATSGGPRPAPREFRETPELKDVHFDFDRYAIRTDDAKVLDANADWLKARPGHLVLIEGHCDERGTDQYNTALGQQRAAATRDYLVARGVAAGRISVISYGEEHPLCREHREGCWVRNRRAHLLVKPQ